MTRTGWKKLALAVALALVAAAAQTAPAAAYQFTFTVSKFAICNPQTKVGHNCSLYMQATNVAPAVLPPLKVRMTLDVGPWLIAQVAAGSAQWSCSISAGQMVTCIYLGPYPVPMGFTFPPITVRVKAKPIPGAFQWAPVCGNAAAYLGGIQQPVAAPGCTLVVIIP
jgi:hypothetical protein